MLVRNRKIITDRRRRRKERKEEERRMAAIRKQNSHKIVFDAMLRSRDGYVYMHPWIANAMEENGVLLVNEGRGRTTIFRITDKGKAYISEHWPEMLDELELLQKAYQMYPDLWSGSSI